MSILIAQFTSLLASSNRNEREFDATIPQWQHHAFKMHKNEIDKVMEPSLNEFKVFSLSSDYNGRCRMNDTMYRMLCRHYAVYDSVFLHLGQI